MKTLLTLRPNQLISLLFGLPIFVGFFFMVMKNFINSSWINRFFFSVPTFLALTVFLGWVWVIGISTNQKVDSKIRIKSYLFKAGLIYTLIFVTIYNLYWAPKFVSAGILFLNSAEYVLSSFCSFVAFLYMPYAIYFIAKNIVMAEKQEVIKFKDCADIFYSFLFLPSGIWVAQTRVQKLFQVENE